MQGSKVIIVENVNDIDLIDVDNKIVTLNVRYETHPILKATHPALQQLAEEFNNKVRKNLQQIKPNRSVDPDKPYISYENFNNS